MRSGASPRAYAGRRSNASPAPCKRRSPKAVAFDALITGDTELRRLNRDFRGKDYATDVLSFPAEPLVSEPRPSGSGPFLGDIAISLGRARAQAREFHHSIEHEVQILMLHGVLHLLGHDHETDSGAMARAEKRWRTRNSACPTD